MSYAQKISVFDEIRIKPLQIGKRLISGTVSIKSGDLLKEYRIIFSYSDEINASENLAGLILTMPVINFTLFTKRLILDFPVSDLDLRNVRELVRINNREVFINKLLRRRYEFFKKEYLPEESDITAENIDGITEVTSTGTYTDEAHTGTGNNSVAVLSSGGKESLLSYGILRETGAETHAFYFNESGSHWFTAKTAFHYYSRNFENVHKVWSNVDRFYRFCLRNLPIIDQASIRKKTDTYPLQLFIFPVYIMSMIPVVLKYGISNAVLGDEFDDPREMTDFRGFRHYYGIFDQSHDFNSMISRYFRAKGIPLEIWSAVYPVSGSVVEKMLIQRYPDLFRLQRSCHSCRPVDGQMIPCGKCSKCLGIMMFTMAAGGDPKEILYSDSEISNLGELVSRERMRLDTDELNLMKFRLGFIRDHFVPPEHVEGIHRLPDEETFFQKIPGNFRDKISNLIEQYSSGKFVMENGEWIRNDELKEQ